MFFDRLRVRSHIFDIFFPEGRQSVEKVNQGKFGTPKSRRKTNHIFDARPTLKTKMKDLSPARLDYIQHT